MKKGRILYCVKASETKDVVIVKLVKWIAR